MSINEIDQKINPVVNFGTVPEAPVSLGAKIYYWVKPFYTLILIIVISSIFFALGRLSVLSKEHVPIRVIYPSASSTASVISSMPEVKVDGEVIKEIIAPEVGGEVIGSKSGKKYYFPWCGTVKRIKPENQVHFTSIEVAKAAGFTPGGNCKGLK